MSTVRLTQLLAETTRDEPDPSALIGMTEGDLDVEITSVTHDSRSVRPGAMFCCVRGSRVDGHDHAAEAVGSGARALLVERALDLPVTQVHSPSVRRSMGPLSAALHGHPSRAMRCYGITGTNGKTTVTFLLEAIERHAGHRVGLVGTVATRAHGVETPSRATTPEAPELQSLLAGWRDAGVEAVAMEVSSHGLALHRADGTEFAAVGFTNLSHDHLDFHGTMDAYFEAKARLFTPRFAARAAINGDDAWGARLVPRARAVGLDVLVFGEGPGAALRAESVRTDAAGTSFVLFDARSGARQEVRSGLIGAFNVSNLLAAAACALQAGMPFDTVVGGLNVPVVVPGRLEPVANDLGVTVLVDYAHSPDALANVLRTVRALAPAPARVLVVFGCGGDRDRDKRPLMGAVAEAQADVVVLTSDNPRGEAPEEIARDVLRGMTHPDRVVEEPDRRGAIRLAIAQARPGDVVLIAGKGHETGQTGALGTVPFDDRLVAAQEVVRA